jgi:uncharacterized FlaG/YvyC family protein
MTGISAGTGFFRPTPLVPSQEAGQRTKVEPAAQETPATMSLQAQQTKAAEEAAELSKAEQVAKDARLREMLDRLASAFQPNSKLVIRLDQTTDRFVYEFRDGSTDELVRQFPAEDVLRALAAYREAVPGKLLNQQA